MKTNIKIFSMLLVVVLLVMGATHFLTPQNSLGSDAPNKLSVNVSTAVTASTTSGVALAASSGRQYAIFCNDGAVAAYLGLGVTAVKNSGLLLPVSGCYTINTTNQFVGIVNVVTASSTAVITVTAAQ